MNKVKYRVTLDLTRPGVQHTIYAKKGDARSREAVFALRTKGKSYKIASDTSAYLYALCDGAEIFADCEISGSTVIAPLTTNILSAKDIILELRLTDKNGAVLTTPQVRVISEKAIFSEDAITATDDFSALLGAITKAENSRIADITADGNVLTVTYSDGQTVSVELNITVEEGGSTNFKPGNALELTENDVLNVKTTDEVSMSNALPLTSKGAAALEESIRKDFPAIPNVPVQSVNGKTGDVKLNASDVGARASNWMPSANEVGALPADTTIPKNTSELNNNSGFITKTVADLVNYYKKSETLTKEEINALISVIPKFSISVVSVLPISNINSATVYLVKSDTGNDLYTEYIYVNGAWEILGSQMVDLTGYATKTWVNGKLENYLPASELQTAINTALAQAKESGEFKGDPGTSVTVSKVTESTTDGDSNVVTFSDGKTLTVKNGSKGATGKTAYQYAKDGGFTGTETEFAKMLAGDVIPEYWESYLSDKISAIKALQDEGGKDCFSFIVMTDMHYESNLGKRAPTIAKRIMDECGIKFALCLGDSQTRHGAKYDEAYIENEWKGIEEMLSPIRDRLLITQGNHDGSYGWFDLNGDGVINDDINGDSVANSYDKDVHNYTPQKLYERIFRKVSAIDNVHFSGDGRGYYVDDPASKVRYIVLNSHTNKWELNDDGSIKYNNMYNFRFGQAQYDMVVDALSSIPSDSWSVICASHVPLDRSGEYVAWGGTVDSNGAQTGNPADCVVMMRLLNAYVNKGTYTGDFAGNQGGGTGYVNLANTSSADWMAGSRFNSSGGYYNDVPGTDITNYIPYTQGEVLKLKDLTLATDYRFVVYDSSKSVKYVGAGSSLSSCVTTGSDGVLLFDTAKVGDIHTNAKNGAYIRLPVKITSGGSPIITTGDLNATITGFDAVSVSADFTDAKGTLISYHGGHIHKDNAWGKTYSWNGAEHSDFFIVATRSDGAEENESALISERVAGTVTEQSFDVFTVNKAERKIYATKIGAGDDRVVQY